MCEESVHLSIEPEQENDTKISDNKTYLFKIIRKLVSTCHSNKINFKQLQKLKEKHEILKDLEILKTMNDENSISQLHTSESKSDFKNKLRIETLNRFCKESENEGSNLWFFAAAACRLDRLKEIAKHCDKELLRQPRCCDSALVFLLKYGNILQANFFECIDVLLSVGVSVNTPDFNGKTAIDVIYELYENNENDDNITRKLKTLMLKFLTEEDICWELLHRKTKIFLQTVVEQTPNVNPKTSTETPEIYMSLMFAWISKEQTHKFFNFANVRDFCNCDNGEYTLLQFASKRSEKMQPVIKCLLEHGADPNKVTEINTITPLELAAKKNHDANFREILKNKNLKITQDMFNNFVKWRCRPIKLKIFEMFLESEKLDPRFIYKTTGNTPLHYATRFHHKEAIQKLLKRCPESLFVENKSKKTALDAMEAKDLEDYFDSCLALDTYTTDVNYNDYKMLFRFKSLISKKVGENDEIAVLSKISKCVHLEQLLAHPLIHTFIVLKWSRVVKYYWIILFLQGLLFLALSICFYRLSDFSEIEFTLCIFFTLLNCVLKSGLLFAYKFRKCDKLRLLTLYEFTELLLMLTLFGSFTSPECRAFALLEMSILFLLTAGYHPKIAKWSVMLKKVFKSFTILMLFFSVIIIAFAAAFHVLFKNRDHKFFESFWKSIFITYVMITGEFNISEVKFTSNVGGYILFFLFTIFMTLVIVNFWTGVAVTDISAIEKDAEINAFSYVITFLTFVQRRLYSMKCLRPFLPCPFLFIESETEKYEVDFYINKKNQFEGRKNFPRRVDKKCLEKIKNFQSKRKDDIDSRTILTTLQEVMKILNEMKNSKHRHQQQPVTKTNV